MSDDRVRVVLVDDHPVVLAGFRAMMERSAMISLVAETDDADEAIRMASILRPEVMLIDLSLANGRRGPGLAKALLEVAPGTRLIIYTATESSQALIQEVTEAGFSGFLRKDADLVEVEACIGLVASGSDYFQR